MREHACVPWAGGTHPRAHADAAADEQSLEREREFRPSRSPLHHPSQVTLVGAPALSAQHIHHKASKHASSPPTAARGDAPS